ncbi:hypothetical protein Pcinc_040455 [Petrolisthes cinctipes]|uniref:Uncharacterized protein n=1 Tax=Petrolisthes cinctipes TaxID=88211 RepID=A0AAE1BLV9_PETCI|nr:hypothetical protein Pcinc_040455 [Petrolisthes cinctipes]
MQGPLSPAPAPATSPVAPSPPHAAPRTLRSLSTARVRGSCKHVTLLVVYPYHLTTSILTPSLNHSLPSRLPPPLLSLVPQPPPSLLHATTSSSPSSPTTWSPVPVSGLPPADRSSTHLTHYIIDQPHPPTAILFQPGSCYVTRPRFSQTTTHAHDTDDDAPENNN